MRTFPALIALVAALSAPVAAQVALPLPLKLPRVSDLPQRLAADADTVTARAAELAQQRLRGIERLVRRNADAIEHDAQGQPARRGELLALDLDQNQLRLAERAGFTLLGAETIPALDLALMRLGTPPGLSLAASEELLRRTLPTAEIAADALHFRSGVAQGSARGPAARASARGAGYAPVGVIDGAPGSAVRVAEVRGFASGAPLPGQHGSAVVSLLAAAGAGTIRVADVYGGDKAGGNALAIARALGWLVSAGSRVVSISLVGPRNPVVARAVAAAQGRGVVIVAAVGNDGPAAPPAYPASYPGVLAVTAVDGKRRPLLEAGRALHLDYAAPGADIRGLDARGKPVALRGTSFATPLVAARVAQAIGVGAGWRGVLDAEAVDLGRKGPDPVYGRGLLCAACRGH